MENRFKFRAWDSGVMIGHKNLMAQRYAKKGDNIFNDPTHILMQSTSRKEENGRLIFESDIYELKVHGIDTHVEYIKCVVEWSPFYCLAWKRISEDSEQSRWLEIGSNSIFDKKHLGNIYENKELLK